MKKNAAEQDPLGMEDGIGGPVGKDVGGGQLLLLDLM